eukprot:15712204-Heterocapsa_arctica.AAC.1
MQKTVPPLLDFLSQLRHNRSAIQIHGANVKPLTRIRLYRCVDSQTSLCEGRGQPTATCIGLPDPPGCQPSVPCSSSCLLCRYWFLFLRQYASRADWATQL